MTNYKEKIKIFTEEVWNQQNFTTFETMIHPTFVYNDPIMTSVKTKAQYHAFIARSKRVSSDMYYEILDIIAEDNKVVVLYKWTGTPRRKIKGVPPSGKQVEHNGIVIYYFENDTIVKIWDVWDLYSLLTQLRTQA
jgi:steroid delta-isomerase-like uncharacterized protein